MKARYRQHFLLDPQLGHLNHGAFGATPRPVLQEQWSWQKRMEARPVAFHAREHEGFLRQARQAMCDFLGAALDDTAFVVNTTTAMNWVAHSLPLGPDDEVLLNDHEYGAVYRCWKVLAQARGFRLVEAQVPLGGDLIQCLETCRTSRTRAVVVSHLTSATAQCFPVQRVGQWAQSHSLWSIIDGAHVPGHLPLNLAELGVDFYMGNFHKWLWAPKSSAFLWVRPSCQELIRPLIVSWGVDPIHPIQEPPWVAWMQLQATRDLSAMLASPAGIDYQRRYHEPCQAKLCWQRMEWLSQQLEPLGAQPFPWAPPMKMRAFAWDQELQPEQLRRWLLERFGLEVPVYCWNNRLVFRICLQHYVCDSELERLIQGLSEARVLASSL